jgi:hypothetical protein
MFDKMGDGQTHTENAPIGSFSLQHGAFSQVSNFW